MRRHVTEKEGIKGGRWLSSFGRTDGDEETRLLEDPDIVQVHEEGAGENCAVLC